MEYSTFPGKLVALVVYAGIITFYNKYLVKWLNPPTKMLTMYATVQYISTLSNTEVEFLEEIQTEVLRVFLLAIHRHLY